VKGGIDVKLFLGSASTHLLSGLGGFEGRSLRKGDVLRIRAANGGFRTFRKTKVAGRALEKLSPRKVLRVTAGPQSGWFTEDVQRVFYGNTFRVAEESNRMGLRLEGAAISTPFGGEMISEGVSLGAVQITASGLPIILFVEQQTTGGYPKIANVISADLSSLGQLRPRDEIRFERVELDTARMLLLEQEKLLASKELIVE
jgi:antagonist of KipI